MGISLNHLTEGAVAWFPTVDANWSEIESAYVAREKSDTGVVSVTGTTSETVLMNNTTIPANALAPGVPIRTFFAGTMNIAANTTPTITLMLRWGGLSGTDLGSIAITWASNAAAYTVQVFYYVFALGVTAGASGSVQLNAWYADNSFDAAVTTGLVTLDTTTAKSLVWTTTSTLTSSTTTQRLMNTTIG
jgi:hypothetical protein